MMTFWKKIGSIACGLALSAAALSFGGLVPANTAYGSVTAPAPGVYPRVSLTSSELTAVRDRITMAPASTYFVNLKSKGSELTTTSSTAYQAMVKLEQSQPISSSEREALSVAAREGALVALVETNSTQAAAVRRALTAIASKVSTDAYMIDMSYCLGYVGQAFDWVYGYMTTSERDAVRNWIVASLTSYEQYLDQEPFGFKPGSEHLRNFGRVGHTVGAFGVAACAIEGLPGYQQRWFDKASASMFDFLNHGIGVEGDPMQSIHYFALGMRNGVWFLDAMARRGQPVWSHPNLMKVPTYWTYDMFPWPGDFNSNADTDDLMPGIAELYARLALAYPNNPVAQWAWSKHRVNPHSTFFHPSAGVLWAVPDALAPVPPSSAAQLNLALSKHFPTFGQVYHRSDWTENAIYLQTQAMPTGGPSHEHADRNAFTLAARNRLWAIDPGFGSKYDRDHNAVLIDGKGGAWYPHKGYVKRFTDTGQLSSSIGDATTAYSWTATGNSFMTLVDGLYSEPYNPVVKAYRNFSLWRGSRPYVVVTDDIKKDANPHTYEWPMLTPMGSRTIQVDPTTFVLESLETAGDTYFSKLDGYSAKFEIPFSVPSSGEYEVYFLQGRHHSTASNWGGYASFDTSPRVRFFARPGDNAPTHWQRVYDPYSSTKNWVSYLTAGSHKLVIDPINPVKHFAALIVPKGVDPRTPGGITQPAGSVFVDFGSLAAPTGWAKQTVPTTERMLIKVLSPSSVSFSASYYLPTRPAEEGRTEDRSMRVSLTAANVVEPKFRVLLYPHRVGDPLPTFTTSTSQAVVNWPDGTSQTWTWGSDSSLPAGNTVGVSVTEGSQQPANTAPSVNITSPSSALTVTYGTTVNFAGSASDFEDGNLSGSIVWSSSLQGTLGTGATLSRNNLQVGSHTITARVTDANGTSASRTVGVTVNEAPVNNTPSVSISSPANGTSVNQGTSVTFSGSASDTEDGSLSSQITWTSSLQGNLGTGASFSRSDLVVGSHTITARVTDSAGASKTASCTLTVNAVNTAPSVTVSSPSSNITVNKGASVTFSGSATDTQDGTLTSSLTWTSSLMGQIGTGGSFSRSDLTVGTHTITARATDSGGLSSTKTVSVTVQDTTNQAPAAPSNLTATNLNGGSARLAWTDNSNNESGFRVERQRKSGKNWVTALVFTTTTQPVFDSPGAGQFRYRVQAYNSSGNSAWTSYSTVNIKATAGTTAKKAGR